MKKTNLLYEVPSMETIAFESQQVIASSFDVMGASTINGAEEDEYGTF
ncbi:MAG: hypothetical protein ACI3ZK_04395 [Candidatus Cryptobacteroides sp.]